MVLNDVCPWESVELGNSAKLLTVTSEMQLNHPLSTSSSTSSVVVQAAQVAAAAVAAVVTNQANFQDVNANNSASSDEEDYSGSSTCRLFRQNCCMGNCRRTRSPGHAAGKKSNARQLSSPKIHRSNWREHQPVSLNSSPVAKFNGLKRFLSLSPLAKKHSPECQTQYFNPLINVSMVQDEEDEVLKIMELAEQPVLSGIVSVMVEPTVYVDGQATISGIVNVMVNTSDDDAKDETKSEAQGETKDEVKGEAKKKAGDKVEDDVGKYKTNDTMNEDVKPIVDEAGLDMNSDTMSVVVKPVADVDGEPTITGTTGKFMIEYLILLILNNFLI